MSNLILMVGLPGSGKTTVSLNEFPDFVRISQDELGSKQKCLEKFIELLNAGKDIIIDRTNINKKQRADFITIAQNYNYNIHCLFFYPYPEKCVDRIIERRNHPTITEALSVNKKRKIVYDFYNSLEHPSVEEGISLIVTVGDIDISNFVNTLQ